VAQVIVNLLGNAIKFTPRFGQIIVLLDAAHGCVRLRVIDTGIGIDPSFLPHVFAHFSQSDSSITRTYGGLGLGLALVRHLVELQGGTVEAQSKGRGHGATLSVSFPVARASDKSVPEPSATARPDRHDRTTPYFALRNVRVLFVDDDFRTREAVLEVLQLTGASIGLAASAADGIMALDTFKPQVIVCDIAMPGEDGYAFIRKVRARELGSSAKIPALALTALASADDKRRALEAGFQLHLAKPIDIDDLRDAVLKLAQSIVPPRA
jgi:CheY-like chemotaxis protein